LSASLYIGGADYVSINKKVMKRAPPARFLFSNE
jgi:hypothetical protein